MKSTKPIQWHGYHDGALPSSQVASYNGTEAVTHDGRRFNVHPRVTRCGGPECAGGPMDLIECPEGAYPIRWEEN